MADGMERVIGMHGADRNWTNLRIPITQAMWLQSWLKIGEHKIDNMLSFGMRDSLRTEYFVYYDEDPGKHPQMFEGENTYGDKKGTVTYLPSPAGVRHERTIFGPDEKMEQVIAMRTLMTPTTLDLYDVKMRQYIREKYNVEIPSLAAKWDQQCWNCFTQAEATNLQRCSKCMIAVYCNKDCQTQDWNVHKLLHKVYAENL